MFGGCVVLLFVWYVFLESDILCIFRKQKFIHLNVKLSVNYRKIVPRSCGWGTYNMHSWLEWKIGVECRVKGQN